MTPQPKVKQPRNKPVIIGRRTLTADEARRELIRVYRETDLDSERLPELVQRLEAMGLGNIVAEVCRV